ASGNYRAEGAPTGTVRVSAELSRGFSDMRTTETKTVELAPGASAQLDLEFVSNTVVRGRVTRNGAPLANASVMFLPRGGQSSTQSRTTTDDAGNYTASGLTDGTYDVSVVDMQRFSPYSSTYNVHGSSTYDIDIKA